MLNFNLGVGTVPYKFTRLQEKGEDSNLEWTIFGCYQNVCKNKSMSEFKQIKEFGSVQNTVFGV